MKLTALISSVIATLVVLLPLATVSGARQDSDIADKNAVYGEALTADGGENAAVPQTGTAETAQDTSPVPEKPITVAVLLDGEVFDMELEEYLVGVVAGEMPASFEAEALKAQAVAARTYTLFKMLIEPSENHPEADVCGDSTCCKAFCGEDELKSAWGGDYDVYMEKIKSAVRETRGEYMTYDDEPILAVFHASSAGKTEMSGNVWQEDLPYLQSVASPESADTASNYVTKVRVSQSEFADTIQAAYPDAELSGDPDGWLGEISRTESGRADRVMIGGVSVRGTYLRSLFGLRSTYMDIEMTDGEIVFTVTGNGHGVGMSQWGANTLAQQGRDYREILRWYYTGIGFENTSALTDFQ